MQTEVAQHSKAPSAEDRRRTGLHAGALGKLPAWGKLIVYRAILLHAGANRAYMAARIRR